MDSNNPYANIYINTDVPSLAKKTKAAAINDKTYNYVESLEAAMRSNKFYDSRTSASQNADQVVATLQSEVSRSANIVKARLHENTKL
jgi:hypothetical protein